MKYQFSTLNLSFWKMLIGARAWRVTSVNFYSFIDPCHTNETDARPTSNGTHKMTSLPTSQVGRFWIGLAVWLRYWIERVFFLAAFLALNITHTDSRWIVREFQGTDERTGHVAGRHAQFDKHMVKLRRTKWRTLHKKWYIRQYIYFLRLLVEFITLQNTKIKIKILHFLRHWRFQLSNLYGQTVHILLFFYTLNIIR